MKTLEFVEDLRAKAETIYDALANVESVTTVEALFFDSEKWPIADWKVEDNLDDIETANIVASVHVESNGREKSVVNDLLTKEVASVSAKLNALGFLVTESTEVNTKGGGRNSQLNHHLKTTRTCKVI